MTSDSSDPMRPPDGHEPHARCGAYSRRTGRPCRAPAMRGQQRCRMHGGSGPGARRNGELRARRDEALRAAERLAERADDGRHPVEHLLDALAVSAHVERVLADEVSGLESLTQWGASGREVHVLLRLWGEERDRRTRYAKIAADAGVDERRTRLSESQGEQLAAVVSAAIARAGLDEQASHDLRAALAVELRAIGSDTEASA